MSKFAEILRVTHIVFVNLRYIISRLNLSGILTN